MLTEEQNQHLTQTGPGTPCGALMRRYWQPVALSEELSGNRPVKPVRLLGENLVLFRDDTGRLGLVDRHCCHRGADLAFGRPECGVDMTFNFQQLIEHVTRTRTLGAGAIIGSGTISNYDRSRGSSCLAEKRMLETIEFGEPKTPFLKYGDRVRIEMLDAEGRSIFGAIDQKVVPA